MEASVGHIRDLPDGSAQVPEKYRDKPWKRLAVDVDGDFTPIYVVTPAKKTKVTELRKSLAGADELLLATDEDREGEAIAWHLLEVLAESPGVADGVQRDHPGSHHLRRRAHPRPGLRPGRRAGDAPGDRSALRLRGLAGALAQGAQSACRPAACSRWPCACWWIGERERIAFRAAEYWDLGRVASPVASRPD